MQSNPRPISTLAISMMLATALATTLAASPVHADSSDSMRVGDMHYGNGLDPSGWGWLYPDPRGFSWLHPHMLRTPSGALYPYPPLLGDPEATTADTNAWQTWGLLQLGYLALDGDTEAQFFRQYTDWEQGLILGVLAVYGERPSTGDYVELRASVLSADDNYLRIRAGRYGVFKAQAFHHSMPHVVASNAWPLWEGIGSTELTLPEPLIPGESTVDAVVSAAAQAERRPVRLVRTRDGLSIEGKVYADWLGFASITNEEREGTRLWGGTMFFNFPFPDNGGVLETVRPIDFSTTDISVGLRHVGTTWRFNSIYTGSFFRNHKDYLNFDSPFDLWNVVGTPAVGNIYNGEFSLEPDNNYHNLRFELARNLAWNGELSLAASAGTMRQDDPLRAPVTCTGKGGIYIAPPADFTFNCADWNTPAALSRDSAEARIDTALLYAKAVFRPSSHFGWHAELRWYEEDNKTNYLAFNPLTGEYGYIAENGAQGSIVPGELGLFDPDNPLYQSTNIHVRSIPFAWTETSFELGADWRLGSNNTLDLSYRFERMRPEHRERTRVDEQRLSLAWVNRSLGDGTLRVSAEHARRRGDSYHYNPYEAFYSESLPGFVLPDIGLAAHTTSAMRKYDLSDREQSKLRAILIYPLGDSMTASATLYASRDDHDTQIGRQQRQQHGATAQWLWQSSPRDSLSIWLGLNRARMDMANVFDIEALVGNDPGQQDPRLGGPLYPLFAQWMASDRERNQQAGVDYFHNFGRVRLDLGYDLVYSRSELDYAYVTSDGGAFPDNRYRMTTLDIGLGFDLAENVAMRVFGRRISGSFHDWHYAGLDATPVIDHRIYTDRGPMEHYVARVFGVLVTVGL